MGKATLLSWTFQVSQTSSCYLPSHSSHPTQKVRFGRITLLPCPAPAGAPTSTPSPLTFPWPGTPATPLLLSKSPLSIRAQPHLQPPLSSLSESPDGKELVLPCGSPGGAYLTLPLFPPSPTRKGSLKG